MTCIGVGIVRRTIKENAIVPKGVYDGVTLRMVGKGNHSTKGGQPGDLLLKVTIRPHPYFRRDACDIKSDKYISVT